MFYSKKVLCSLCIIFSMFIGGFLAYITFANEQKTINKRKEIQNEVIKEVKDDMKTRTRVGVVAAPKEIELGSKIYIPILKDYAANGMFSVEDRGSAVKIKDDGTYIIDVWISNHDEVEKFGRKKCTVYLQE